MRATAWFETFERRVLLSAGQLDPFFGSGAGYLTTAFPGGTAQLVDFQTRSDGLIMGVGTYTSNSGSKLILARFGPLGHLDESFGGGSSPAGFVETDISGSTAVLKLLKHGQFLVASGSRLVRFNDNGSVDSSFVQDEPSRYKFAWRTLAIDIQPDGKIVLSGRYKQTPAKPGHFAVARLKASGGRDKDFGLGGVADFWQHTNSRGTSVRAMADGSIYVAGDINHGYPNDITEYKDQEALCAKLESDGSLDTDYGDAGVASISGRFFAGSNMVSTLATDGTATIVAAGDDNYIYRITPQGVRDTSFASDGVATGPSFNGGQVVISTQDDGAALMSYVDYTTEHPPRVDKLVRWTAAGAQDMSFGASGQASFQVGDSDTLINAIKQETDGSIVVAGQADGKLMLARFWSGEAPAVRVAPRNVKTAGGTRLEMRIDARDDVAVNQSTMTGSAFAIRTPTGATITPAVVEVGMLSQSRFCYGTMILQAPGGSWDAADNGEYQIQLIGDRISDTAGHESPGRTLGSFWVNIT